MELFTGKLLFDNRSVQALLGSRWALTRATPWPRRRPPQGAAVSRPAHPTQRPTPQLRTSQCSGRYPRGSCARGGAASTRTQHGLFRSATAHSLTSHYRPSLQLAHHYFEGTSAGVPGRQTRRQALASSPTHDIDRPTARKPRVQRRGIRGLRHPAAADRTGDAAVC